MWGHVHQSINIPQPHANGNFGAKYLPVLFHHRPFNMWPGLDHKE